VMATASGGVSTYRWSRAAVLRLIGVAAVVLGVLWLALGLLGGWLPGTIGSTVEGVCAALTAAALAAGCLLVARPPRVLELSAAGYRIWHLRGAGVHAAGWSQVEAVDTQASRDGRMIVVELSDGRTSTVPVTLLGARALEVQREMHERLNGAFGYRSLREAADWSGSTADG
jgi:hypothetical protein